MRETWRAIRLLIGTSAHADPVRAVAASLLDLLGLLSFLVVTVGLKYLTDGMLARNATATAAGIALIVGMICLSQVAIWASTHIRVVLTERVGFAFDREVATMSAAIPGIEHHERADYQDKLELVRSGRQQLSGSLNELLMTVTEVVSALGVLVVLAWLDPVLLLLALFALPAMAVAAQRQRWYAKGEERSAGPSRLMRHLREITRDRDAGMELRVFGLHAEIRERLQEATKAAWRPKLWSTRRATVADIGWQSFLVVSYVGAIGFMLWRAVNGQATAGDVVATVYICRQVAEMIVSPIFEVAMLGATLRVAGRLLWLRDYAAVAARLTGDQPPPERLTTGIVFDDVSFTYPGTDHVVLRNLSLTIPAGSVVALVGDNGAGKTTFVKLLTRMYEPTRGRILVDGVDLADIDVEQWRARLSAAFQDFCRLELTAQHSVGTGDVSRVDDAAAARSAVCRAGAADVLADLPDGLATQLGSRWDGGVDLSTGQWQKLALGRALMRDDPLVAFFDEPTASLDAPTEHALFARYADAARRAGHGGAVTVLVSHRFST
ncbi:MAG: ATP-binding cassette domain-containing protein, partial [Actinopolymorphaceae bacterium]